MDTTDRLSSGGWAKAEQIERILERRIRHGDYLLKELPGERDLAVEIGVSRMTARKAVQRLVNRGLLERLPNGRVAVSRNGHRENLRIAFLVPSLSSPHIERWRLAIDRVGGEFNARLRTILYVHWDDPAVIDALEGFDGVFLNPSCEPIPRRILERLREAGRRIVVLEHDLTSLGIPSIRLFPPSSVQRLLDLLAELGHRSVDCFNVQTVDPVIEGRIEQWNLWRASHRMRGQLLGRPIKPYETPLVAGYEQMGQLLDQRQCQSTSLLCTTAPAAIGAVRAMHDRGLKVGQDLSVCVVNDEGLARYMSPSLTSIEMPDPTPYLLVCLEWMREPEREWMGSLLMQPAEVPLYVGESTGPARSATTPK